MRTRVQARAEAGYSLIELLIVVALIGIISSIATLYAAQARQSAQSASAIASLRIIGTSQNTYHTLRGRFGDLTALQSAGYLNDQNLANGQKDRYLFAVTPGARPDLQYTATATPLIAPANSRHFFLNESSIIRANAGAPASAASDPLG